jgi:serine/threonine protein kinase
MIERTIFLAALDVDDPARRRAYLDQACAGDAALRRQVEALLAAHARSGTFLDVPAVDQADSPRPGGGPSTTGDLPPDGPPSAESLDADVLALLAPAQRPGSLGRLDHYEVLELVGRGGMGLVFRAFDEKLERVVAIKALAPQLAANATARRRFVREARATAAVTHDNVIDIHAVEDQGPVPFLVMQFINGCTLQQKLDGTGPLSLKEVLRIGLQTAAGLAAAHHQGLIHRDVKPSNILLENGVERVKLTDFGLARAADEASLTQSGVIAGTPPYMSPEQAEGKTVDHRSDLFSLGSVLYACCTGRAPFRAGSAMAVLRRVCDDTPRPVREVDPEVPQWLADMIAKLHGKDPAERFQSAQEVANLLGKYLTDLQMGGAAAPVSATRTVVRRPCGRRVAVTAGGLILAALGAIAMYAFTRPSRESGTPTPSALSSGDNDRTTKPSDTRSAHPVPGNASPPNADEFVARVASLTAEGQVKAVEEELRRRNLDFDGKVSATIVDGVVTGLALDAADGVTDISPVRALRQLQRLDSTRGPFEDLRPLRGLPLRVLRLINPRLKDLAPLEGMALEELTIWGWSGTDLSPLRGMRLKLLNCGGGHVKIDLTVLKEMPLTALWLNYTAVENLSPLSGLPLTTLGLRNTPVTDLTPLKGMPLQNLEIEQTRVKDLSALKGAKLETFHYNGTLLEDVSVLKDMPLRQVTCDFRRERDEVVLRAIQTLQTINGKPAAQFWKELPPKPNK